MEEKEIRLLQPEEIECRTGSVTEKGVSLLLYKDARADMKILDETFGMMNWQRSHEIIGGRLYCTVSVWDDGKKQWISKSDVGTESHAEKEKGQASDSFKRACFSLGIGRELYTAPFIWVPSSKVKIEKKDGRLVTYEKFRVADISYGGNREINGLTIVNRAGACVFSLINTGAGNGSAPKASGKEDGFVTGAREEAVNRELIRTGVALDAVLSRYGVSSITEMSDETYDRALAGLRNTKSRAA